MGNCLSTCLKCSREVQREDVKEEQDLVTLGPKSETKDSLRQDQCNVQQIKKADRVHDLVQQELATLQEQIKHSQAVLASLTSSYKEGFVPDTLCSETVHRTTQTVSQDAQPKSLECVSVTPEKQSWQQITTSCPAIVSTVNIAVQTDEETSAYKGSSNSEDYFLPPISPLDSQASDPSSPKDLAATPSSTFEPRGLGHIDLDIYRSCRKLSVLPEEEPTAEDVPTPLPVTILRLAPTHYPTQQAHSFESYLLPEDSQPATNVRRQMSDPTPSPEIHPISRRSSRSTCRPLQIQSIMKQDKSGENYFKFPEVVQLKDAVQSDNNGGDKTSLVKFVNDSKLKGEGEQECMQRVKSPTYGILQNTVSQLITISQDYSEVESYITVENESNGVRTRQTLVIPANGAGGSSPYNSAFSSPGFYTPQSDVSDLVKKSSAETLTSTNSSSSSFQTPSNTSPDMASSIGDVNKSVTTMSYKTALDCSHSSTVINSPVFSSPNNRRRIPAEDVAQTSLVMDVDSLDKRNSTLYVKPIGIEQGSYNNNNKFDRNRTMLSILIDSPRDQKQQYIKSKKDLDLNENNTSLVLKEATTSPVSNLMSPNEGNTTSSPTSVSTVSSLSPEPGAGTGLSRVSSRRKLTRSLARVSSQTVFELVGPSQPGSGVSENLSSKTTTSSEITKPTVAHEEDVSIKPLLPTVMDISEEEGLTMRRTSSDAGSGVVGGGTTLANGKPLISSHSFPSLSDHVLKHLGLWMGENNPERSDAPSTDKEIENKFTSLILAFKTDKLTLKSRLELQSRLRDQSEKNMTTEVSRLRDAIQALSPLCIDSEKIELLESIQEQVEALYKSTIRVSSAAELFGAVQQENRLAKAVDIILHHVENLKQAYEKERTENEEARRLLLENKILPNAVTKLQNSKRRASIATLHRAQSSLDSNKSPTSSGDGRTGRSRLGSLPRRLSNTIPEAETEDKDNHLNHGKDILPLRGHLEDNDNNSVVGLEPSSPAATRSSSSRKSSAVTDNHSIHGDSETEEEETLHDTSENDQSLSPGKVGNASMFINQRFGSAGSVPWLKKLNIHFDWVQPFDQLLLQIRYCIAVMLLIAAVGVFSSTFFLPHGV